MSTDYHDRMQQGTSSNCCGAIIMINGLCSDCGEHCTDDGEEGPTDEQQERMMDSKAAEIGRYRQQMKDAGREHLLPP
jgi:predicted amidophosphoribosyltransferase